MIVKNLQRNFVIHTDYMGMILFNLAMLGLRYSIHDIYYAKLGKYSKYPAVLAIGPGHHGNIKAYVNMKNFTFDIYNGTTFMYSIKDLDLAFHNNIKHLI
jgi:hypothetical protein